MKLEYFRQKEWEEDWINDAEKLVREAYVADYEGRSDPIAPAADATPEPVSPCIINSIFILTTVLQVNDNFATFTNISVMKHIGNRASELGEYLQKPVKNVKEPLKWWVANRHVYPNLYRMALDYLSIPGK